MSPTFLPKKTIQQVSRPLKNPVFYENGFGGVLARPFANPRGSGGFEWLQSLESVRLTMAPNYDSLDSLPLQTDGSTGGLVGSTPFVCGGEYSGRRRDCYTLQDNGAWIQDRTASLNTARGFAAFAPNYDSLDSLPLQAGNTSPGQIPIPSNSLFRKNPNGSYNRRLPWMAL